MTNTVPPSLAVSPTLPVLTFNFEQLKAWALGMAEHYSGLIVTEDGVLDAKRDMAEINKAKAAVDAARKEAVRQVSEPIRTFEAQVKKVSGIFDQAYAKLAEQVKVFEQARRSEKRASVEAMIKEEVDAVCPPNPTSGLIIAVREEWLNKTASLKSIRGDIKAEIEKILEAERRQKELEQARQDRAGAIESHVKALNLRYGFELPVTRFLDNRVITDMACPLADHLTRIESAFAREAQARQVAAASTREATSRPATQTPAPAQSAAPEAKIRAMSIVLEYSSLNEKEVQACLATLKSLCIDFGARYRQE